jgi:hypothetical protein
MEFMAVYVTPPPSRFLLIIFTFVDSTFQFGHKMESYVSTCTIFILYLLILGKDVVNPNNYGAEIDIFHNAPIFEPITIFIAKLMIFANL